MQRRSCERVQVHITTRFHCQQTDYLGTVTNLSQRGMYICLDRMCFPFDSELDILLPAEDKILSVPVYVRWVAKSGDRYDGIGVEVLAPDGEYSEFVSRLTASS